MMTNDFAQAEVERHVEFIGACYVSGRAEGASPVAVGEVPRIKSPIRLQHVDAGKVCDDEDGWVQAVDPPGDALFVAQGGKGFTFSLLRRKEKDWQGQLRAKNCIRKVAREC